MGQPNSRLLRHMVHRRHGLRRGWANSSVERFELLAENSMLKKRLAENQSEIRALKDEVAAAKNEATTARVAVAAAKNGMDEVMDGEGT